MTDNNSKPLALINGSGPGLGVSLGRALSAAGYKAVGLNRSVTDDNDFGMPVFQVDTADGDATRELVDQICSKYGAPEVVIHNPANLVIAPFLETSLADFEQSWRAMVLSAVVLMQTVLPGMLKNGKGNLIVTGATASLRGSGNFSAFASAKFALRGLTQSLAREYQKQGIHVAHVILDGIIDTARSRALHGIEAERMMHPDDIANACLQLIRQPVSTWSHELDLRPMSESF